MKIIVNSVSKKFKESIVLEDVNLTFESGKIYGLVGRNGSGKSVFLKLLCGFFKPTSGSICYDDIDINKKGIFAPDTRALIEKPCFISELTGYENLKLLADIQKKIGDKEIRQVLHDVKLDDDANKEYSKYSLGMRQKLGIAQVLMEDPNVMIFDEPFNGIEKETAIYLRELLKKKAEEGKLIILASHIEEDMRNCAHEIYEFDGGRVTKIQNLNSKTKKQSRK